MKIVIILSFMLLSSCSSLNNELQNALAFGAIKELNLLNPEVDKQLLLRLYKSPSYQERCFKETHGVCQYVYFLSVSTFDEYPETNIYRLKTRGDIVKINWQNGTKIDSAKIIFIFNKFTSEALKNNKTLINEEKVVHIVVNTESISESGEVLTKLSN